MNILDANKISFLFPLNTYDGLLHNLAEHIEANFYKTTIYEYTKYRLTVVVVGGSGQELIAEVAKKTDRSVKAMYSNNAEVFVVMTKDELAGRANDIASDLFNGGKA